MTPLEWRCAEGHVWSAAPSMVKPTGYRDRGTWCPVCARLPTYSLKDMRKLAGQHGGECLSKEYVNGKTPLRWRCAQGHTWEASAQRVVYGSWCALCARNARKLNIEEMHAIARARGGRCLSTQYINCRTPLRWQCAKGHVWLAKPNKVKPYGPAQHGS